MGRVVSWSPGEAPLVDFPGNLHGPLPARSTLALDADTLTAAIADERPVVLLFEDAADGPPLPILTGLLVPPPGVEPQAAELPDAVRVDGRRVEIEGADEIVLRCGKACIVLRRNGRVVIRGTYVESRSRGVNRVKGGSVEIN